MPQRRLLRNSGGADAGPVAVLPTNQIRRQVTFIPRCVQSRPPGAESQETAPLLVETGDSRIRFGFACTLPQRDCAGLERRQIRSSLPPPQRPEPFSDITLHSTQQCFL